MEPYLPWYIAGPLIGLIVPALLFLRHKQFGISSSFSFVLSQFLPKNDYFKSAKTKSNWQFHFAIGIILSAISSRYFLSPEDLVIENLVSEGAYLTGAIYAVENAYLFLIGGILIGFGAGIVNYSVMNLLDITGTLIDGATYVVFFAIMGLFAGLVYSKTGS